MKRPEDIPEDVWDAALETTRGWMEAGEDECNDALVRSVSRAILSAKKLENEGCAVHLEHMADEVDSQSAYSLWREAAAAIRARVESDA